MQEQSKSGKRMGRPVIFGEQVKFEMRTWSKDIIEKIDERRGEQSRRAYIEHLLRTHPEMREEQK